MCKKYFNRLVILFILISVAASVPAYALTDDSKKKLYIYADASDHNYKTGVTVFSGNVKMTQGTTHLTAERVITKSNQQNAIEEAIAYGDQQLAHYWTTLKIGEPEIYAEAKVIKFYPLINNIILENEVLIRQGKNSFQGQLILYNRAQQTITVPASKNGRAVLLLDPNRNDHV